MESMSAINEMSFSDSSAKSTDARSQSSRKCLQNTHPPFNTCISQNDDTEYGLKALWKGQASNTQTQGSGTELMTNDAIDLSIESPSLQNSLKNSDAAEERSSYEIAAEALCLMKSGGVKTVDETQISLVSDAQINTKATHSQITYPNRENKLIQNEIDSSSTPGPNVIFIKSETDRQAYTSLANSHMQSNENNLSNNNTIGSRLSTLTLPSDSSCQSLPTTAGENSGELIKYVLVPQSALLSSVNPGKLVSVPCTPYLFMMQGEKNEAAKAQSAQEVQTLSLGQKQLEPKRFICRTDTLNSQFVTTMSVDISCNTSNVHELQNIGDPPQFTVSATESNTGIAKRSTKKHDTLKFPPCIICDGEASGFHYGCNTCEACKNFFRRCLLRKSNTPFMCHGGKKCEISYKKNKNNCSACRLEKCLERGMAKEKCKMGRYTALMRTETIKKVRKLEGKDIEDVNNSSEDSQGATASQDCVLGQPTDIPSGASRSDIRDLYDAMISKQIYSESNNIPEKETSSEYNDELVEYLVSAMEGIKPWGESLVTEESRKIIIKEHYEKYKAKVETFGQLNDVSMQEYQDLLRKYGIDIDGQWETFRQSTFDWEGVIGRYCKFAKCIPEFSSLSFDDQACLLKATHFEFFVIVLHQGYVPEYGVFLEINGVPLHIEEAANRFFSRELVFAMTDMMSNLLKMNLSKAEMALLISIVTMSSDQCILGNPTLVENTQLHLVDLLLRETNKISGHVAGRKRFTAVIDILTKMRDVSNIYYKEYRALCKDEFLRKEIPNLDCVLPDEH